VGSGDLADGAGDDSVGIMVMVGSNVVLKVGVNVSGCGIAASVGAVVTSVGASVPMGAAEGVGSDVATGAANGVGTGGDTGVSTGGDNGISTGGDNGVGTEPGAVVALGTAVALGASVALGTTVTFRSGAGAGVTCKRRSLLLLLASRGSFSMPTISGRAVNETTAKVAKWRTRSSMIDV
jgi:hypothetical protein